MSQQLSLTIQRTPEQGDRIRVIPREGRVLEVQEVRVGQATRKVNKSGKASYHAPPAIPVTVLVEFEDGTRRVVSLRDVEVLL